MKYSVIYEPSTEGVFAYVPDLPGATSYGRTQAEAEVNIRDAVAVWIEETRKDGQPIPPPSVGVGAIEVEAA